jgi:hypothetical protein
MDMRDIHSNKYCSFLTILDNVLTVGELAGGQERDSRPHPNPGDLLGGAGRGMRNLMAADFAKAPQGDTSAARRACRQPATMFRKLLIQNGLTIIVVFFTGVVLV